MEDTVIFESSYHPDKKIMRRIFGVLLRKNRLIIVSVTLACFFVSLICIEARTIAIIGFLFSAVAALTAFFLPISAVRQWQKQQSAIFNGELGMIHTRFSDKEIEGIVERNTQYFQYSQIIRVRRIDDIWLLMLAPQVTLAVPVDSFTLGAAADFPAFIREKCPGIKTNF